MFRGELYKMRNKSQTGYHYDVGLPENAPFINTLIIYVIIR